MTSVPTDGSSSGADDEDSRSSNPDSESSGVVDLAPDAHDNEVDLSVGEIFDLLKNERRRQVIAFLKTQDDNTASLSRLAEHIAALENEIEETQVTSTQRKRVYISLYQTHLPKLDDYGVIEFHRERGSVELKETEQFDAYFDAAEPKTQHQFDLYIALAVAVVVVIGLLGIGPFGRVPSEVWTILSLGALLGLVIYRYYTSSA